MIGVQAALAARAQTGRGQHVDLSLFDCGVGVLANQAMNWLAGGVLPKRLGNAHPNIVPYQVFPASDGHLIIACGNDRQFAALCDVLGLPGLAVDAAFATNPARVQNREALVPQLAATTANRPRDVLIAALEAAGVPAGPINTVAEALSDRQIEARGMRIAPEGIPGLRTPIAFSENVLALDRAAPALGTGDWSFAPRTTASPCPDKASRDPSGPRVCVQRCPSSPLTFSFTSPPRREFSRPPVPMTSENRISSARGASWIPTSMLLKWLRR